MEAIETNSVVISPIPVPGEVLVDIPSAHITGAESRSALVEFSLNNTAKRLIFEELRRELKERYFSHSDNDGFIFSIDWGVYHITAQHHYTWSERNHNCEDAIEITEVWDTLFDCNRSALPGILNAFYKRE